MGCREGGAAIARQVTLPGDGPTGVFLSDDGGTHPWRPPPGRGLPGLTLLAQDLDHRGLVEAAQA